MTSVVVPAILAATPEEYRAELEKVHTFASRIHVDVSDGTLALSKTVAANQIWWPQNWQVDVHAMVAQPSAYVTTLTAMRPHTIIFHAEVQEDLLPLFRQVQQLGIKAGLALQRSTVPSDVSALIQAVDHVMIFSGNLGQYGGTANLMQLEKVRLVRAINPSVEIGWDGGANIENVFSLAQGGVDVLNVGGAIQRAADAAAMYTNLVKEVSKQGAV